MGRDRDDDDDVAWVSQDSGQLSHATRWGKREGKGESVAVAEKVERTLFQFLLFLLLDDSVGLRTTVSECALYGGWLVEGWPMKGGHVGERKC